MKLIQRSQKSFATLSLAALMTLGTVGGLATNSPTSLPASANPAIADSTEVSGTFTDAAHTTTGTARIVTDGDARYLELSEDFGTDSGPDLLVLLHRSETPDSYDDSEYVSLGMLEEVSGTQRYLIPDDVDVEDFRSTVIWCREFNVTFGFATLG
ncbi:MAG: DM13 domain-containing protein [Cyanobacteria bacterium P01_E01_bin.34]